MKKLKRQLLVFAILTTLIVRLSTWIIFFIFSPYEQQIVSGDVTDDILLGVYVVLSVVSTVIIMIFAAVKVEKFLDETIGSVKFDFDSSNSTKSLESLEKVFPKFAKFVHLAEERFSKMNEYNSNIAHNLKDPLMAIHQGANAIKEESSDTNEFISDISTDISVSSYKLIQLVNSLLRFARYESPAMILKIDKFDLIGTIKDCTRQQRSHFESSFIPVDISYSTMNHSNEIYIEGDETVIEDIFNNLISNALKYGENYINIQISEKKNSVVIKISNDGEKIPKDKIDSIFERFYREKTTTEEIFGTGIGLAVVKDLVNLHNGTISVTSGYELTTFVLVLPKTYVAKS